MFSPSRILIFDMDGVLVDTEPIYKALNMEHFARLGVAITDQEYNGFIGIATTKMWTYIKEKGQLKLDVPSLIKAEDQQKIDRLKTLPLSPMPGLLPLLEAAKAAGIPIALASSSSFEQIGVIIRAAGIAAYFDFVLSGTAVKQGKPAPDIFLTVAAFFGVEPAQCLVIEDSRNGTLAAKSAGMHCVGLQNPNSGAQDLSRADWRIDAFDRESREAIMQFLQSNAV